MVKNKDKKEAQSDDNKEDTKANKNQEEQSQETKDDTELSKDDIIKKQEETIEQLKDKYRRAFADFENYKRRAEEDKQSFIKYANEGLILEILEAYEDLGRALEVKEDKDLREGVELIYKNLTKLLEKEEVKPIEVEHQKFDPYKHEALLTEANDDYENNEIIQELQRGYTYKDKVIRYSKVKVCKK